MSNFDYENDIEYSGYLFYKNKLINVRTYERLLINKIKILLPINKEIKDLINRKNKILNNKKDFGAYQLSFKDYRYVDGFDGLLGINKAITICAKEFKIPKEHLLGVLTIFPFQVFSRQDIIDVLTQSGFKNPNNFFLYLKNKDYILRLDNSAEKTIYTKMVFAFSNKGFELVKLFYDTLEKASVFDFKFKNKSEVLVDDIIKKYE